jgi:PAS domain S-box-containing protein
MTDRRILIVEDEAIVAKNIEVALKKQGYCVLAIASSGEEAIQKAAELKPDMVLMDIRLRGDMLGVEAARQIRTRFGIPVIYLTAHADTATLERAKLSEPFGYLIKPFKVEDLHGTIEMALYKHELDQKLKESETRYRLVSELTSDFAYSVHVEEDGTLVVEWATDAYGRITGFAPRKEMPADIWQGLVHPDDQAVAQEQLQTVLAGRTDAREYRIVRKDGEIRWLRNHARPAWDEDQGRVVHILAAVRDITERKRAEEEREGLILELQDALAQVKTLSGLLPICASCKKIRDDKGYWTAVETYILRHSEAEFSHGLCPGCARKLYPDYYE